MWDPKESFYNRLPIVGQNLAISWMGAGLRRRRFGPGFREFSAFLEESERRDTEFLLDYQSKRLATVVRHAYETVPYYRETMDVLGIRPADVRSVQDLGKLPILSRADVLAEGDRLLSSAARSLGVRKVTTAGTTGAPLTVYWDHAVSIAANALTLRIRRWAGLVPGVATAVLQGRAIVPLRQSRPPFWRYNRPWNQILLSALHMAPENMPHYLTALRRFGARALVSYPSAAYAFARFLSEMGEFAPLDGVILTGEPLFREERALIEERFATRAFDVYGQAERVVHSSECERHDGHHVFSEFGILELVDGEGEPVGPGERGRVVGTTLHNLAMPLLRYAFGDTAVLAEGTCACGRTLPLISSVASREEDLLVTPRGRVVPPMAIIKGFGIVPGLTRSQIVQREPDAVTVRLETPHEITPEIEHDLRAYVASRLGPEVTATFERLDEIPLSPRGKFRRVISTVPLPWRDADDETPSPGDPAGSGAP